MSKVQVSYHSDPFQTSYNRKASADLDPIGTSQHKKAIEVLYQISNASVANVLDHLFGFE